MYMYVNESDNYLFVSNAVLKSMCMLYLSPSLSNAVLKSMCMLYLSPSLCYIDSLCNWHMNIKKSNEVRNILSKLV